MSIPEFIAAIETYYGITYNIVELKIIQAFLKSNIDDLEKFFKAVISHHSKKWRSLPDLVIFREVAGDHDSIELQAEIWWQKLLTKSSSNDVLITDVYAHFVVNGYGSWDRFCEARDGQYRELTHKDFITRYINAAQSGLNNVTPHVLMGFYGTEFGPKAERVRIIGDQDQGKRLLAGNTSQTQIEKLTGFIKQI